MIISKNGKSVYALPLTLDEFKNFVKDEKCFYLCSYNSEQYLDMQKEIDCPEAYKEGFISIVDNLIWLVNYYEKHKDAQKVKILLDIFNNCMSIKNVDNIDVIQPAKEQNELLYDGEVVEEAVNKNMNAYILEYHHKGNEYWIVSGLYDALYKIESGKKQKRREEKFLDNLYKE